DMVYTYLYGQDHFTWSVDDEGIPYHPNNMMVISLTADLSEMNWCALIGDDGRQSIAELRLLANGNILFCGESLGDAMPVTPGAYQPTHLGEQDGYIGILSADGSQLLAATYFGEAEMDETVFADEDSDGNIWTFGYASGHMPLTNAAYGQPGSRQYLAKLTPELDSLLLCSEFGSGPGSVDNIYPNAFMIDNCDNLFVAGYKGYMDAALENMDLTDDALFESGGFYMAKFEPDMTALAFGTYVPGDHVDSGENHFDPSGKICLGICSALSGFSNFIPVLPGYTTVQTIAVQSAVYVFSIPESVSVASFIYDPQTYCLPYEVVFTNTSTEGTYSWNLDDTGWFNSDDEQLAITITEPGQYQVSLAVYNASSCNVNDTVQVTIDVPETFSTLVTDWQITTSDLCADSAIINGLFTGTGADWVMWNFEDEQLQADSATFVAEAPGNYELQLYVYDETCGFSDTLTQMIGVGPPVVLDSMSYSGLPCAPAEMSFFSFGNADEVSWNYGDGSPVDSTGLHVFHSPGSYQVSAMGTGIGCVAGDTLVSIIEIFPVPDVGFELVDSICLDGPEIILNTGSPVGGYYQGPGVSGDMLDPIMAGDGTHEITYFYSDENGCSASNQELITVIICDGINESVGLDVILYPNPADVVFAIVTKGNSAIEYLLINDALGRRCMVNTQINERGGVVDISNLPPGCYTVCISLADTNFMRKLIVQ
ncbi:MAG: T9SS type A sorting domain-containing protein, partial [Flavobacteriales bacterium]|nr:T9SS type A sorting domain-containing protein [Flavobacteriales bacterium]